MKQEKDHQNCLFIADCLDRTASFWSNLYTLLIFLSLIGGILVLTDKLGTGIVNWIVGLLALIFSILLQIFKDKIEKVQGYRQLSNDFKILNRALSKKNNSTKNLEELDRLTKKLSDYPLSERTKKKVKKLRGENR